MGGLLRILKKVLGVAWELSKQFWGRFGILERGLGSLGGLWDRLVSFWSIFDFRSVFVYVGMILVEFRLGFIDVRWNFRRCSCNIRSFSFASR